ncbi:outer membrane protein assembly factor BamD [Entomomonas moraniae]|uniref:Outer membrane protein assembly factor BamD n=1 Tax=Entomomonas moraniae TaxID=2213226 RepID=A0A3Q9JL04_9GAMM|nr:outer membrane protein assembly factor BamD [Entomomonas moraniae]AZS52007.1 outer membrane protein assembly factor BamD [Entomomonas moraniae]
MRVKHLLVISLLILISACSNSTKVDENLSEVELYQQAQKDLNGKNYSAAIAKLKALDSRYPFGRYTEQAQLELIYAYYKISDTEAVRDTANRFIRLNPDQPNVDYAYYMRGLAAFDQDQSFLARFIPLDMTTRDPGAARVSYNDFAQLTRFYPNSAYAPDAKIRMVYLRNLLAAYEAHVGVYYLERQAYIAAARRGTYIVEHFDGTPSTANGLAIMVEAYQRMGMTDLANSSLEVLKLNYPKYPAIASGTYKPMVKELADRDWFSRTIVRWVGSNNDPLPPGQTRANEDLEKRYQDALEEIPKEIKASTK